MRPADDHTGLFLLYSVLISSQVDSKIAVEFKATGSGSVKTMNKTSVYNQVCLTWYINTKNQKCCGCSSSLVGKTHFGLGKLL